MPHGRQVLPGNGKTGQQAGQQQVETGILEMEGAGGNAHDLDIADAGQQGHGAGSDRGAIQ